MLNICNTNTWNVISAPMPEHEANDWRCGLKPKSARKTLRISVFRLRWVHIRCGLFKRMRNVLYKGWAFDEYLWSLGNNEKDEIIKKIRLDLLGISSSQSSRRVNRDEENIISTVARVKPLSLVYSKFRIYTKPWFLLLSLNAFLLGSNHLFHKIRIEIALRWVLNDEDDGEFMTQRKTQPFINVELCVRYQINAESPTSAHSYAQNRLYLESARIHDAQRSVSFFRRIVCFGFSNVENKNGKQTFCLLSLRYPFMPKSL